MNIVELSKQTREEASKLLQGTQITKLLSTYGDVRVGGSYFSDLMYGPDVDITVVSENPRQAALSFLDEIIQARSFQKYQYGDFEAFPRVNRPKAHIVVLIAPYKNQQWEIEIWFSKELNQENIALEQQLKDLPQDIKAQILTKKHERAQSGIDKNSLSSFDIYKQFI